MFPCTKGKYIISQIRRLFFKDHSIMVSTKNYNNIIRFSCRKQTEKLAKSELAPSDWSLTLGLFGRSPDLFRSEISSQDNLFLR